MSKRAEEAAKEIFKDGIELFGRRDKNNNLVIHPETMVGILRNAAQRGYELAEKDLGWHSVDESLPPIDEEVIVLTDEMHGKKLSSACHISYGHRPNPEGWDGKDIFTGKVTHHDVVTYDGWNIPGVKYWMPSPKIPEEK